MQRRVSMSLLAVLAFVVPMVHGQVTDDSKPASTSLNGSQYPRVTVDGRVIFRVKVPDAQKVQIVPLNALVENIGYNGMGKGPYEMTKDSEGYWTVTTPPIAPGFHYYSVVVDGASFNDPSSETFFGSNRELSGVDVPEPGVDFYLPKEVPHGQVRLFWHYSKLTAQWRQIYVYTPPNYDSNPGQRFPVLYLRHGGGEDQTGWTKQGHANFILDNLIAAGKAKPMIVVMENGYTNKPGEPLFRATSTSSLLRLSPEAPEIAEVTVKEVIPAIDANFRTIPDRDHRAMAGLSMGSLQALSTALHNLDTFSSLGVFSRPPIDNFDVQSIYGGVLADSVSLNKRLHLFWFGAGTEETGIFNSLKATRAALDKAGVKYTYVEYAGLTHEWKIWRKQLSDFAPLLFQW